MVVDTSVMGVFSSYSPIVLLDQVLWSMTQPRPSFTKLMYVLLSRTIVLLLLSRTIVLLLLSRTIVLMLVSLSRVPYYSGLFLWRFILCFRESTNFYTMNFDRIIIYAGGGGGGGVIHNTKKLNHEQALSINTIISLYVCLGSHMLSVPQNTALPGPLPLGVAVIDASIMLFGKVFHLVSHKHRNQLLSHFKECIKQAKSARQQALLINIFTAFLAALKVSQQLVWSCNCMILWRQHCCIQLLHTNYLHHTVYCINQQKMCACLLLVYHIFYYKGSC